jgi:hypothetical protein
VIGELAVAVSSVLRHSGGEPAAALPLIAAFDRQRGLRSPAVSAGSLVCSPIDQTELPVAAQDGGPGHRGGNHGRPHVVEGDRGGQACRQGAMKK